MIIALTVLKLCNLFVRGDLQRFPPPPGLNRVLTFTRQNLTPAESRIQVWQTRQPASVGHLTCQFFSLFFSSFVLFCFVLFSHILTYDDIVSWSFSVTGLKWFWKQITILVVFPIIYPEPSGPPLDVLALTKSSTSILVKWNPPSELDRNGVISHYIVTYNESLGSEKNITTSDNRTQKLVSSLRKYSPYYFTVQAVNNIGVGPPSVAVINTTAEDSK